MSARGSLNIMWCVGLCVCVLGGGIQYRPRPTALSMLFRWCVPIKCKLNEIIKYEKKIFTILNILKETGSSQWNVPMLTSFDGMFLSPHKLIKSLNYTQNK